MMTSLVLDEIEQGLNEVGLASGIEASALIDKYGTPEAIAAVVGDAFRVTAHKGPTQPGHG